MSLQPVYVSTKEIGFSRYHSNLKADYASGVSAITVYSISQFAINKVLLIGEYGSEGSEIIKTHASTAPTGFTVTLASATAKPHTKDTPVYIIPFDQIEFSHADTLTGAKSVLGSVVSIDPEEDEMLYEDTTNTSGYYFTRYKNSITSVFSDYSDGIPYTGLPQNTVGYAIDTAMNELGARFTERLTFSMMISFSKQMLKLIRGKLKSWNNYKELNQNFGTLSQGVRRYSLPSGVYDQYSNKSIASLRVGNGLPLTPIDRDEYLRLTESISYTEIATEGAVGATSLVLDDTSDLADDGSINVFVSGTKYTIEYTANTRSTNTLTVGADQITATLTVDSPVWQGIDESNPEYFSVQDGYVYLWPLISSDYEGNNLTGDFLTDIETIDSQMDVITGLKYDALIPYLKFKIRAVNENSGKEDLRDPSYQEFRELLTDAIKNEPLPESVGFRPRGNVIEGGRTALNRR
jgi:hypothetical protein